MLDEKKDDRPWKIAAAVVWTAGIIGIFWGIYAVTATPTEEELWENAWAALVPVCAMDSPGLWEIAVGNPTDANRAIAGIETKGWDGTQVRYAVDGIYVVRFTCALAV